MRCEGFQREAVLCRTANGATHTTTNWKSSRFSTSFRGSRLRRRARHSGPWSRYRRILKTAKPIKIARTMNRIIQGLDFGFVWSRYLGTAKRATPAKKARTTTRLLVGLDSMCQRPSSIVRNFAMGSPSPFSVWFFIKHESHDCPFSPQLPDGWSSTANLDIQIFRHNPILKG